MMPTITASPCYSLLPEVEDYKSYQVLERIVVTAEGSYLQPWSLESEVQASKFWSNRSLSLKVWSCKSLGPPGTWNCQYQSIHPLLSCSWFLFGKNREDRVDQLVPSRMHCCPEKNSSPCIFYHGNSLIDWTVAQLPISSSESLSLISFLCL